MVENSKKLDILISRKCAFSIADAKAVGLSAQMLAYYCKCGKINRICRGVYTPHETDVNPFPEIEQLVKKGSEFVVCLLSALQIHEFTTQLPNSLWIAIPQGARLPKANISRLSCIRLTSDSYNYGIEKINLYGAAVKIYSAAKTVADCFKFRNKIGFDVALESLKDGYRMKLFNTEELWRAAKACRVSKIMRPYLEFMQP